MRTTVTLDADVQRLLKDAMHRSRTSFKQTINAAIRDGLRPKQVRAARSPFVVKARRLEMLPGLDPTGFNKLADDLEVEAVLRKNEGGRSS